MNISPSLLNKLTVKTFIYAIRSDCMSILKPHVLSKKFTESDYQKALTLAAFWNKQNSLKYLSNLDWSFLDKDSALNAAAAAGRITSIATLDVAGANIHTEEEFPLYIAANRLHSGTTSYLLLKEPKFEHVEYALKTVFKRGNKQFALDCLGFQAQAGDPNKALDWAVKKNKPLFVVGAVKAGANPNMQNAELLFRALAEGNHRMAELLGGLGADILARGEHVVTGTIKQGGSLACLKVAYELIRKARTVPVVMKSSEGTPRGLKDVNGTFTPFKPTTFEAEVEDVEINIIKPLARSRFR